MKAGRGKKNNFKTLARISENWLPSLLSPLVLTPMSVTSGHIPRDELIFLSVSCLELHSFCDR